jgi:hypothetical protein
MQNENKIFYFNNDDEKPIIAGGVILYKIKNNKIYLLLIDSRGIYEDLGGQFQFQLDSSCDTNKTIFDFVSQEAYKESNYILDKNSIKNRLMNAKSVYISRLKYIVFIISANDEEAKLTSEIFSEKEYHNIPRRIKWVPFEVFMRPEIIKHKVSVRLKNKYFFEILKNIEKDMLEWEIFY